MIFDPAKTLQSRLVLLVGDEDYLRRRALATLLGAAGFEKDDFDLETFVADATPSAQWVASVGTSPFLAQRRCAVVRNLLRVEATDLSPRDLASLPDTALLILVGDDEAGSEDRVSRMKTTVRNGWERAVKAAGGVILTFNPDSKGSRQVVMGEAKKIGLSFTPKAADALVEMTGSSISRAMEEMEKLALYAGPDGSVREEDVREVVVPSREWNVFKLVEATLEGRVDEALRQLRILVSVVNKAEDVAFRSILPVVSTQLRLTWQARVLIDAGKTLRDAPPELLDQFPAKPNLAKEHDFRVSRAMALARRVSLDKLTLCFGILNDTDSRLKAILNSFNAFDTLETMVLEMASAVTARPPARRG